MKNILLTLLLLILTSCDSNPLSNDDASTHNLYVNTGLDMDDNG